MNINNGRIVLTKIQNCFSELNLPFLTESEILDSNECSDCLLFRSWLSTDDKLAEILALLFVEQDVLQLSMNYYVELKESTMRDLFKFMNAVNYLQPACYGVLNLKENIIEFRTAYTILEIPFEEVQFKSVLKRFLDQGPRFYSYIERLIHNNEDPDKLIQEMELEFNDA